ncbi:hypothetical protein B0H14DRAFT_3447353 [Mycena olivaceomarginata]|nr:hypothetical protein B0H14DRAFT_3447353 [Mycena olivaceomarginata]
MSATDRSLYRRAIVYCDRHRPYLALSPSFVRHASTRQLCYPATPLRRFSIPARFYRSSLVPPDLHVEVILMCIAQLQLSTTFPPTLGRHNRLVHPSRFLNINAFEWPQQLPFPPPVRGCADQQASIFLHLQGPEERACILDAIRSRSGEMMMHLFGHWAAQRCLEAATGPEERHAECRLPPSSSSECYGCHVLQRTLDCEGELLWSDPATTLVNKHVSHVWNYGALVNPTSATDLRVVRPTSSHRADSNPSSPRVNTPLGRAACHETGSLLVQRGFENFEESVKEGAGTSHQEGSRSALTTLEEGGKDALDCVVQRMFEPAEGARCAIIVALAISLAGSQLIASVLPTRLS